MESVLERARKELKPFQCNIEVHLADGSRLRAVWNTVAFMDLYDDEPFHCEVVDFLVDHNIPKGGFMPGLEP
jgi:hypothetical protein